MITYQSATISRDNTRLMEAVEAHWEENAPYGADTPLDLNFEMYEDLQLHNECATIVAVDDNGKCIGYVTAILTTSLHVKTLDLMLIDSIYVAPEYRGTEVSSQLLQRMSFQAWQFGASFLHIHTKYPVSSVEDAGFSQVEVHYQKDLKGAL